MGKLLEPPCTRYLRANRESRNCDWSARVQCARLEQYFRKQKIKRDPSNNKVDKRTKEIDYPVYVHVYNTAHCVGTSVGGTNVRTPWTTIITRWELSHAWWLGVRLVSRPVSNSIFLPFHPLLLVLPEGASRRPVRNSYYGRFDAHGGKKRPAVNIPPLLLIIFAWSAGKHRLLLTVILQPRDMNRNRGAKTYCPPPSPLLTLPRRRWKTWMFAFPSLWLSIRFFLSLFLLFIYLFIFTFMERRGNSSEIQGEMISIDNRVISCNYCLVRAILIVSFSDEYTRSWLRELESRIECFGGRFFHKGVSQIETFEQTWNVY